MKEEERDKQVEMLEQIRYHLYNFIRIGAKHSFDIDSWCEHAFPLFRLAVWNNQLCTLCE